MVAGEARDSFPCTVECSTQRGAVLVRLPAPGAGLT